MADANVATRYTQYSQFTLTITPGLCMSSASFSLKYVHVSATAQDLGAFDAAVAADPGDHVNVITSPTQTWIPEPPVIRHMEITTYGDGWWGAQEYTRWPQMFNESVIHHACIPLLDTAHAPGKSVYQEPPPNHFVGSADSADGHVDPYDCETPEFGRMEETVLAELQKQAGLAIRGLRVAEMKAKA